MNKKIPWNNNRNIHMENVELCVKKLIIGEFLAHGAFGLVYDVKYNNRDCVMKIIPLRNSENFEIEPLDDTTKLSYFNKEIDMLKKLDKKRLIPKLYNYGICSVDYYNQDKNRVIKIGYIISEKYDITLKHYTDKIAKEYINKSDKIKNKKNLLKKYIHNFLNIDENINKDLEIACEIGILNEDTHSNNVMMKFDKKKGVQLKIVDWGLAFSGHCKKRRDDFTTDVPFTKKFIKKLQMYTKIEKDLVIEILEEYGVKNTRL